MYLLDKSYGWFLVLFSDVRQYRHVLDEEPGQAGVKDRSYTHDHQCSSNVRLYNEANRR